MPAPTRRLLACATSIAAAVGLLAGCTDGTTAADPTDTATTSAAQPSPSATPSPSVTAVAPQWTAAMDDVSVDGAQAVGQYFLELFTYVSATGDTAEWDRLSHPDCIYCVDVSQKVADRQQDLTFQSSVTPLTTEEVDPGTYFSAEYAVTDTYSDGVESTYHAVVAVFHSESGWLIRAVDMVESPRA